MPVQFTLEQRRMILKIFGTKADYTEEQAQDFYNLVRARTGEYTLCMLFDIEPDEDTTNQEVWRAKFTEAVKAAMSPMIAEMFGITDPDKARSVVQTLVNEAVDKATEPLYERIKRLEEERWPSGSDTGHPQAQRDRDPETVRTEIVPGIVVSVMNSRLALESLSSEEAQALMIDKVYVSKEFVQRIWDREILRDFWGSGEGMRESRNEVMAKFLDDELNAMMSALKKNLKRSKAAQEKANMAWAQYFLVQRGIDPADTKAVRTAMGRQDEFKGHLK